MRNSEIKNEIFTYFVYSDSISDIDRVYVNIATRNKEYKFNMPDNHFHRYYELYYCKSSACSFFVKNRILELHAGDFLLIPPGEMHYTKYTADFCSFNQSTPAIINTADEEMLIMARYITENYDKLITLEDVSDKAGLSYTYFSKKFKATTGMRFKEYLNYVRLKQAATRLATTTLSVTEIAISCGFNDSNYFKDAFKRMYGMPPRLYRKSSNAQIEE